MTGLARVTNQTASPDQRPVTPAIIITKGFYYPHHEARRIGYTSIHRNRLKSIGQTFDLLTVFIEKSFSIAELAIETSSEQLMKLLEKRLQILGCLSCFPIVLPNFLFSSEVSL